MDCSTSSAKSVKSGWNTKFPQQKLNWGKGIFVVMKLGHNLEGQTKWRSPPHDRHCRKLRQRWLGSRGQEVVLPNVASLHHLQFTANKSPFSVEKAAFQVAFTLEDSPCHKVSATQLRTPHARTNTALRGAQWKHKWVASIGTSLVWLDMFYILLFNALS